MSKNFELLNRYRRTPELQPAIQEPRFLEKRSWVATPELSRDNAQFWRRGIDVLLKHWKLSLLFALVTVLVTATATFMMRPVYEPEAQLEVDVPGNEVFSLQGMGSAQSGPEYLATQAQKLQSDELGLAVVRKLHLDQDKEFAGGFTAKVANADPLDHRVFDSRITKAESAALKTLHSRLKVHHDTTSNLISVAFAGHDPVLSARIVNTAVALFVDSSYRTRHDAIQQSTEWLSKQLDDIRTKMENSNAALADFQKNTGLADLGDTGSTVSQQISDLNRQLSQAQAERIQMEAFLDKVKTSGADSLPQVGANPVIQALTQKLAETQAELAETMAVYGKNHPNVKKLQNQATELEAQLKLQRASILRELNTSHAAANARENLLQAQVKQSDKQLSQLARYNELKKEADANTQLYGTLYAHIKEAAISAASKSNNVSVISQARILEQPTAPNRPLNLGLGLVAGIFGGFLLAFVREAVTPGVRTLEDVRNFTGITTLSTVPQFRAETDQALVNSGEGLLSRGDGRQQPNLFFSQRPMAPESEALRGIVTTIMTARGTPPRVLLITSSVPGEGKTTLAVNLSTALAEHGSTCIVDADLRKPGIGLSLGLKPHLSLSDVLSGLATLGETLVNPLPEGNLSVLQANATSSDPGKLICSEKMAKVIEDLRRKFRFVLLDSPPVLPYADARALAPLVDGIIFVCRSGVTTRDVLVRSMELLNRVDSAPVLDVVLNGASYHTPEYAYYYGQVPVRR